ncbi:predicted protein [Haematococcus lacustris]|uniref:Uncharacterized protein n=1 Tax=Haematococcus lacustris TaxID=44745 RepID=A0A699YY71_HAELA|nr:predicted protein [Haematococcus lacustris]
MGASTGKAVKAKTKMGPPAETVAAECPVEAEMSEEEQRRMVQEALQRALEDTATARQQAWVLQEASLRKALLEAAYDDDAREVEGLLAKADALGVRDAMEIADSHGNTLLSEAAAGGACSTLQHGDDDNLAAGSVCREQAEGAARAAVQGAQQGLEAAKREHERCQAALRKAREELEKRIFEHDTCVGEHKPEELIKVTLDQIKAHEGALRETQTQAAGAAAALSAARLTLREQQVSHT